jgi:chromosome partitioning protein
VTAYVIAVANQKGGVGKTTTTVNVAACLAKLKTRVLLIDLDPQGNATMGSGVDKSELKLSINDVLLTGKVKDAIVSTEAKFDILPGNSDLTEAEITLLNKSDRQHRLRKALEPILKSYDFILIDCPPSLNMLTVNALVAADGVLIPMQCEYYALEGLAGLIKTIEDIASHTNPHLHLQGIVRTMYDPRTRLTVEVSEQLFEHFPKEIYQTAIPRNVRLAEAPSYGLPALLYDSQSQGSVAYLMLAKEIIARHKRFMKKQETSKSKKRVTETID